MYIGAIPDRVNLPLFERIKDKIPFDIILGSSDMIPLLECKELYYDNCFVNLNFSKGTGLTTVRELALMGRYTISNMNVDYISLLKYIDEDDIIELIKSESKKIGTVQPSINCHMIGDEWLDVNYWR